MDGYMVGIIVLLICVLIARIINNKANKTLDQSKKAELVDLFSKSAIFQFAILIGILVLFYLNIKMDWIEPGLAFALYTVLLLGYFIFISYQSHQKLKRNNFPDEYIRMYLFSICLRFLGLVLFFTILMLR